MSIAAMNYVWKHSAQKGSLLLLLIAIADNSNDDGEAYPGIPYLAEKVRMSERQVQRMIKTLEKTGEISLAPGTGRGHTHRFMLLHYIEARAKEPPRKPRQNVTLSETEGRQDVTHYRTESPTTCHPSAVEKGDISDVKGDISRIKGDTAMSPEPIEPGKPGVVSANATTTRVARAEPAGDAPRGSPPVKPESDHRQGMRELAQRIGAIPDGKAQGEALRWLLKHYSLAECVACLDDLIEEFRDPEHWRDRCPTWLAVRKDIGGWKLRQVPIDEMAIYEPPTATGTAGDRTAANGTALTPRRPDPHRHDGHGANLSPRSQRQNRNAAALLDTARSLTASADEEIRSAGDAPDP